MLRLIILSFTLLLGACAKPPTSIVLAPNFVPAIQPQISRGVVDLQIIDQRNYRHVLQLSGKGAETNLINASQQPKLLVSEALTQQLKQQGYSFSPTAKHMMTVNIEQMLISLSQHSFKYTSKSNIVLSVQITNGTATLNKKFTATGQSHGPLTADIAVLERQFNQQLSNLVVEIAQDPQVTQYLTK